MLCRCLILLLLLLSIAAAFQPTPPPPPHHPPLLLQGQHSRWQHQQQQRRPPQQPPTVARAAGTDGSDADEDSKDNGGPIKPRAFVTKRMRRGPLGPSSSSSPSNKDSSSKKPAAAPAGAASAGSVGTGVLKLSQQWACVAGCGACCYLQPEERPYLMEYFEDPEDLARYNSMVGDDGWWVL